MSIQFWVFGVWQLVWQLLYKVSFNIDQVVFYLWWIKLVPKIVSVPKHYDQGCTKLHSVHWNVSPSWQKQPPSFLPSPPQILKLSKLLSPLFKHSHATFWFLGNLGPTKNQIFLWTFKILKFFILNHILSFIINCSETCLYNHLYKRTTLLRQPMLSPSKPIPIQLLLYKIATCLMQPATTFFPPQMKKDVSKTTTVELYPTKKWEAMNKKNSLLLHLLYCYLIMQNLINICNNWTFAFKSG